MTQPATLDHTGIAARVPHSASMCLLDRLDAWSAEEIRCRASSHRDPANPLRHGGALAAPAAIEYASQAMALHGSLCAAPGTPPTPGFLAAVRGVNLRVPRLDDIDGDLHITACRLLGNAGQAQYSFTLHDERGKPLVEGRATVILNSLP